MSQYIEFIGPPGAGKTTMVKDLTSRFRNLTIVPEFSNQPDSSKIKNYICIMKSLPFYVLPGFRKLKRAYFSWIKNEGLKGKTGLYFTVVSVALFMDAYSRGISQGNRFTVSDQGAVQHLLSILFDRRIHDVNGMKQLLDEIFSLIPDYSIIALDVDPETNITRLINRDNGISRLDGLVRNSVEAGRRVLGIQKDNVLDIVNCLPESRCLVFHSGDFSDTLVEWVTERENQHALYR